jgi:hypothetical protein
MRYFFIDPSHFAQLMFALAKAASLRLPRSAIYGEGVWGTLINHIEKNDKCHVSNELRQPFIDGGAPVAGAPGPVWRAKSIVGLRLSVALHSLSFGS